ncbi:unnamed protein product [Clonostachys rhizophaga]|uniref:Rhodopsin domain-containing protein n=1 Tax=Clonostachys rhizophaga TaxID=160324 RepID=A0A9N9VR83_9HYPO|nr:unnamed protein product [Clonostachys rhizophaga]
MAGLQTNVFVGFGVVWAVAFLSMIGRVAARRMTKVAWWHEDYFCLAAFVFGSVYNGLCLYWATDWSLGLIIPDTVDPNVKEHILEVSRKLAFFCSLTYAYSIGASKLAILSLYWRLFKLSSIRIPILVLYVIVVAWMILRTFMVVFRCSPVQAYWDLNIPGGHCPIQDGAFFFGTMLPHFLMDVVILILPVVEVFKLRLRLAQKVGISALFLIGIIVCTASVNCLVESIRTDPKTTQMPYDYALNYTWGAVEVNMAVVSSCFPLLRPVFRVLVGSRVLSSYTEGTHGVSYGAHTYSRHTGVELNTMTTKSKRRKDMELSSSMRRLADDEKDILGDPALVKSPDRILTTVTPYHANEWADSNDNGIHVQNDVIIEVHKLEQSKSFNSDHTSQDSSKFR